MVRHGIGRIDADRLDLVDCLQDAADIGPADYAEQDFAAGRTKGRVE